MARYKEQRLWDRMRQGLPAVVRLERVENLVGDGFPDVVALFRGRVTMIELKAKLAAPMKASTPVLGDEGLNQDQKNWHMDWYAHGGRSLILISVGQRCRIEHFVVGGVWHDKVNEWTLAEWRRKCMARIDIQPWDEHESFWQRLADIL